MSDWWRVAKHETDKFQVVIRLDFHSSILLVVSKSQKNKPDLNPFYLIKEIVISGEDLPLQMLVKWFGVAGKYA